MNVEELRKDLKDFPIENLPDTELGCLKLFFKLKKTSQTIKSNLDKGRLNQDQEERANGAYWVVSQQLGILKSHLSDTLECSRPCRKKRRTLLREVHQQMVDRQAVWPEDVQLLLAKIELQLEGSNLLGRRAILAQ